MGKQSSFASLYQGTGKCHVSLQKPIAAGSQCVHCGHTPCKTPQPHEQGCGSSMQNRLVPSHAWSHFKRGVERKLSSSDDCDSLRDTVRRWNNTIQSSLSALRQNKATDHDIMFHAHIDTHRVARVLPIFSHEAWGNGEGEGAHKARKH